MSYGKSTHEGIRRRIEMLLDGRSWTWLAAKAGIPQSTLATQAGKPRFSVDVLLRVAHALDVDLVDLMPAPASQGQDSQETA